MPSARSIEPHAVAGPALSPSSAPTDAGATSAIVSTAGLVKRFGTVVAIDDVSLDVHRGEILALLGPSGCGKTTFLRLVAGFERPDAGTIRLAGREVAGPEVAVPPEQRRVGMVFQDFALFPHMSVAANVGYGVTERSQRSPRTVESLELVGLSELGARMPHELSGGQRQRVALARALAPEPSIILLDEPFSSLDATLRAQVRADVRAILRQAGATAVFVTHDQTEALSTADRVAVMDGGRVLQVGTPTELYAEPADLFVANFVGEADIVSGHAAGSTVETIIGRLRLKGPELSGPVSAVVRPETVRLHLDGAGPAVVEQVTYFGHDQLVHVSIDTPDTHDDPGDRSPDPTTPSRGFRGAQVQIRARMGPGLHFVRGDRVTVTVTSPVTAFPVAAPSH